LAVHTNSYQRYVTLKAESEYPASNHHPKGGVEPTEWDANRGKTLGGVAGLFLCGDWDGKKASNSYKKKYNMNNESHC